MKSSAQRVSSLWASGRIIALCAKAVDDDAPLVLMKRATARVSLAFLTPRAVIHMVFNELDVPQLCIARARGERSAVTIPIPRTRLCANDLILDKLDTLEAKRRVRSKNCSAV